MYGIFFGSSIMFMLLYYKQACLLKLTECILKYYYHMFVIKWYSNDYYIFELFMVVGETGAPGGKPHQDS